MVQEMLPRNADTCENVFLAHASRFEVQNDNFECLTKRYI